MKSSPRIHWFAAILAIFACNDLAAQTLSVNEQASFERLSAARLHEFKGNVELAEYMRLRKAHLGGELPSAGDDIVHYARLGIGQPYMRGAQMSALSEADCVTFTERCIALACTDNWQAAWKLQTRLRYIGGIVGAANLNHEPIAQWIPSNKWLVDDLTEHLGAPHVSFDVVFDRRKALQHFRHASSKPAGLYDDAVPGEESIVSSYIPKEAVPMIARNLQNGDLILVIGRFAGRPIDPVVRTRCIHMGILRVEGNIVTVLHSTPPAASEWTLDRLFHNPSILGCKILRIRPDARQVVTDEFARLNVVLDVTPETKDDQIRRSKGQFVFVAPTRPPDATMTGVDGVLYGVVEIRPGETLWSLFKDGWKSVCNLDINRQFMDRHPDLRMDDYVGDRVYVPLSRTVE